MVLGALIKNSFEKRIHISIVRCLSVLPPCRQHFGIHSMDFHEILYCCWFTKTCQGNQSLVSWVNITDTWHEDLLKCMIMALISIELRTILIIVLEKIKRFSCQIFFFPSIVPFTIQLRKIRQSKAGHRWCNILVTWSRNAILMLGITGKNTSLLWYCLNTYCFRLRESFLHDG